MESTSERAIDGTAQESSGTSGRGQKDLLSALIEKGAKELREKKNKAMKVPEVHVAVTFRGEDAELFVRGYFFYARVCKAANTEPSFAEYLRQCHEGEAVRRFNAKKVPLKDALADFPKGEKGKKKDQAVSGEALQ